MKETRGIMGMPITVEIRDSNATFAHVSEVFDYFQRVDEQFSTYKPGSEISRINRGELLSGVYSLEMKEVFTLAEETKKQTAGYFDIRRPDGLIDPSGLVKGWAIFKAAGLLKAAGLYDFYIEAGGDIAVSLPEGQPAWRVGIKNPFNTLEIVKVIGLTNLGLATSGTYERGAHIYNPLDPHQELSDVVSLTVIAENVYEADRFATAAFAMGERGIEFLENRPGLEGYQVDKNGIATFTSGFERFVL
jgi:thiamine biosynthesis lipoprotein